LYSYLAQEGFFSYQKVAWVDIGWNGTLQHFLQRTFGHETDYPQVRGYYFALVPKLHGDFFAHNQAEGIIHDSRRCNDCERVVAECEEIFEQGARALHGSTIGYVQQAGRWEALLKPDHALDRQAELQANPYVEQLQVGIMQHWQAFQQVQQRTAYTSSELLP